MNSTELKSVALLAADAVSRLQFAHSAAISPDGARVAWCRSSIEGNEEVIELLLWQKDFLSHTRLTQTGRSTDPEFSPDGNSVAYLHAEQGSPPQVHVLDVTTSQVRALTDFEQGIATRPRWSPDGKYLAFTVGPAPRNPDVPFRVTRDVPWRDGIGLTDDVVNDVYLFDVQEESTRRLTECDSLIGSLSWLPDSSAVCFAATGISGERMLAGRVCAVTIDGQFTVLAHFKDVFSVTADSAGYIVTSLGLGTEEPHGRLFTLRDGIAQCRSEDLDINGDVIGDIPVPFVDPDPNIVLYEPDDHGCTAISRVQNGDRIELFRIPLHGDGKPRLELRSTGSLYPLGIGGSTLLYAEGFRTSAPELFTRDLESGETHRVTDLAKHNESLLRPVRTFPMGVVTGDATRISATFMSPEKVSGPQPTVLLIHGGPESAFGEVMFLDALALCEAGISVLMVNPRGSRGYGREFRLASRGDWGGVDADDLLAAVEASIAEGLADMDRIGVAGLSFGGFMTTWLIGQTHRFKAAVAENAVTNLVSLYGTSDIGTAFTPLMMNGDITEDFATYVKSSPVSYAEGVETPTLLIVSSDDHRCPPEQSLQFYHRLRASGCVAEMLVLPGESHVGSTHGKPMSRYAQNAALVDWMAQYLLQ